MSDRRRAGRRSLFACLALILGGCANAVYIADQMAARSRVDAADRADLDSGNIAAIRDRYENADPATLPLTQLALYCDVLLKYQELGRASDCLGALQARVARDPAAQGSAIARALPGKQALLALALGRPEVAAQLTKSDQSLGGRYVYALASIRNGETGVARPIADALSHHFEPAPVYYAASLYAALGDFPSARAALEDPARRLLADYGLSGHTDIFGGQVGAAVFRLDVFDEFDFGLFGKVTLAPAANAYVEYLAALSYMHTGGFKEAERRLDVLLNWPNIAAFRDVYWRALTDRADLARRAGDPAAAEALLRKAIDLIEEIRGSVGGEAARIAVIADKEAPYRTLVDLMTKRGDARDAVQYVERAHSRALVELLAARYRFGPPGSGGVANRLVAEYDRRAGEVQLASAAAQPDSSVRLARLNQARRDLLNGAPEVADLVTVTPPDLAQVQRSLGAHEAALVYFPGDPAWHVFTVTAGGVVAHDVPAASVTPVVVAFRRALASGGDWQTPDAQLYREVVLPALAGVDASSLVIVPSGVLFYVPFAAVGDGSTALVDRYALRIVPNLSLIARPPTPRRKEPALVIGNPLRDDPHYTLPFAEQEARDVAAQLPGATLLLGPDATIARFQELVPRAGLIHFAGHGVFNAAHPLDSALLFVGADDKPDLLAARRLYDMRTDATLAFLSACETGVNALGGGGDLMGMERGFFYAGASSVIASLWPVQDKATAMLAHEFYRAWNEGAPPSRALQTAQLAVRRAFPQPAIWSPFVVASVGPE
jgi:CHAT domain-containing protein